MPLVTALAREHVENLVAAWHECSTRGTVLLRSVEGPHGSGKSAVLHELYRRLAAEQPGEQPYWPRALTPDAPARDAVDRLARMRTVYPSPVSPGNVRMTYFWWGLTAGRNGTERWSAALDGDQQLADHIEAIRSALVRGSRLTRDRLSVALQGALFLAGLAPLQGLAAALVEGHELGAAARDLAQRVREVSPSARAGVAEALHRNSGRTFTVDRVPAALQQAADAGRALALVSQEVPFVVVVDQAQDLDCATRRMLDVLVRSSTGRGLVVLLVSTDGPAADDDQHDATSSLVGRLEREGKASRLSLRPWRELDLRALARDELVAAGIDDPVEIDRAVGAADGSPGRLVRLLDHRAVRMMLRGAGVMLPGDLAALADGPALTAELDALPERSKRALAEVAVRGGAVPRRWLAPVVDDELENLLERRWLRYRVVHEPVIELSSREAERAAREAIPAVLTAAERAASEQELVDLVHASRSTTSWSALEPGVRESLLAAATASSTASTGSLTGPVGAMRDELIAMRLHSGRRGASPDVLRAVLERSGDEASTLVTVSTAESFWAEGDARSAINLLQTAYEAAVRRHGPDDPRTFPALHNLAAAFAGYGQVRYGHQDGTQSLSRAVDAYVALLDGRSRARNPYEVVIETTMEQLTECLAALHRFDEALQLGSVVLARRKDRLGADDPEVLGTEEALAGWMFDAGRMAEAIAAYRRAVADRSRVFGPDDPSTLAVRNNLAECLGQVGRTDVAVDEFQRLLADVSRVLGPDHPFTLNTQGNVAAWLGEAGRLPESSAALEQLLADQLRVVGPDDALTLRTRSNLAVARAQQGQVAVGIDLLQQLLADRSRVLGPDHRETLLTGSLLAFWLHQADRAVDAIELLDQVVRDRTRVLGATHQDTLAGRGDLATMLADVGRVDDAVAVLDEVHAAQAALLGDDHPQTLRTRMSRSFTLGSSERTEAWISELRRDLDDHLRVLGAGHPNTLLCRIYLGTQLRRAGRRTEALDVTRNLVEDSERALGPEHPQTVLARQSLAATAELEGRSDGVPTD